MTDATPSSKNLSLPYMVSDLVACALIEGATGFDTASRETKRVKQLLLDEIAELERLRHLANEACDMFQRRIAFLEGRASGHETRAQAQPIETAPSGGKWMLGWWPEITDCWVPIYKVYGRWHCPVGGGYDEGTRYGKPRLWHPLPALPDSSEKASAQCQHDLLEPNTTVEVEGDHVARCTVCKSYWATK